MQRVGGVVECVKIFAIKKDVIKTDQVKKLGGADLSINVRQSEKEKPKISNFLVTVPNDLFV